jgi:hypothetical protein
MPQKMKPSPQRLFLMDFLMLPGCPSSTHSFAPLSPPPKCESQLKIHNPFITTYFLQLIVRIWPFHFSFLSNVFNFRRFLRPKSFARTPPNHTSYVQFSPYFFYSKTCFALQLRLAPTPPTRFHASFHGACPHLMTSLSTPLSSCFHVRSSPLRRSNGI